MPHLQPLKLLVISMMYEPDCVGIAAVASDLCAALAERGHQVTVFTTYPYYPEWRLKAEHNPWRVQCEQRGGVTVWRHRIYVPSNPSRLIPRMLHELSFPFSLMRSTFRGGKYDAVMVFCPLISGLLFAALRKLFYRDPLWVNIQDVPVEAAASSGIIRSPWVTRMAMVMQKLLFDRADVWTTISPEMVDQVARFKPPGKPLYFCPNWLTGALGRQIQELPPPLERRRTSRVNLVYCGTIGKKQGLLELCQALGGSTADFRLQIYGDGSEAGAVRRWVESARDERFGFAGLLPTSEFVAEIRRADWFVVPQKSDVGGAFLPSKLLPAISIGTPILAVSAERGPLFAEVTRYGLGQVVSWAQVGELAAHWARIAPDSAAYSELQRNCLRRARDFDRSAAIDRMESLLRSHVGGSSIELASDPKQAGASPAECDVGART